MQFSCDKDSARHKRCCKRLKILQEMRESQQHLDSHGMYSTKLWSIAGKYLEDPKYCSVLLDQSMLEVDCSEILGGRRQAKAFDCSVLLEYVV